MGMNQIKCVTDIKNTGVCGCFFDPKLIYGGILVPKDRVFTEEELSSANIATTMNNLILASKAQRGFPFIVWQGITDNSEEPTIFTSGYGVPIPVREGLYNWLAEFSKGGVQLSNALRSFNGLTGKYAILLVEQTNKLIGTKKVDANGDMGTAGISLETLYTYPWAVADGTNPARYRTQLAFKPEQINEYIAFHDVDKSVFNLLTLNGLTTVNISESDFADNELTVYAVTDCGEDMYEEYADELAQATAWVGIAASDGDSINPTNVAKNDAAGGWDLTFAETIVSVNLAAAAVLAAAPINVVGYEGVLLELGS